MGSEWMGRYRELVAAIVLHGNVVMRIQRDRRDVGDGIILTQQQWQILEYIVEHRDETFSMNDLSYRLDIPQSTFSKTVKLLCGHGLVDKYQTETNRKNIILQPTEYGLQLYERYARQIAEQIFRPFFAALEAVSDEDLHRMAQALEALDNAMIPARTKEKVHLVKLEKPQK